MSTPSFTDGPSEVVRNDNPPGACISGSGAASARLAVALALTLVLLVTLLSLTLSSVLELALLSSALLTSALAGFGSSVVVVVVLVASASAVDSAFSASGVAFGSDCDCGSVSDDMFDDAGLDGAHSDSLTMQKCLLVYFSVAWKHPLENHQGADQLKQHRILLNRVVSWISNGKVCRFLARNKQKRQGKKKKTCSSLVLRHHND